jgi:uncharacterized damage-inducible protein DinB
MRIVDPFLAEMDQEAKATRRLLERLPEDKLSWKPHPKSMSLGKLATHLAMINGAIAGMGAKDTFDMPPPPQPDLTTKAEILAAFDKSLTDAKALLNQVDDARAMANWSMNMGGKTMMTMPRAALYRIIMCSHQYHHRGQLTVYLRLLDVPLPSVYGPSADENPWAQ